MNMSLLIIGGDSLLRAKKAKEFASEASSTFDTIILDTSKAGGIGEVRSLNTQITRRPFDSPYQTVVIIEAQNLTFEAQNALLKNLEEPPSSVRFILTASTTESLLSTISSRCQKLELTSSLQETLDQNQLEFFCNANLSEKYNHLDKLDLEAWAVAWRSILLSLYGVGSTHKFDLKQIQPRRILNYIKLINKMRRLERRRASSKLIKSILLLETPIINKL